MSNVTHSQRPLSVVYLDRAGLPDHIQIPPLSVKHTWQDFDHTEPKLIVERSQNADVLVVNKVVIDAPILDACPKLKHIVVSATGYNIIDIDACIERGVSVSNVPSYAATPVSEHVIGVAIALRRELGRYTEKVEQGAWSKSEVFCLFDRPFKNLHGATIGLIGLGEIGLATAKKAHALGMNVLFCARRSQKHDFATQVSLEELIEQADVISVHCSLNETSHNLIGTAEFGKMKRSAILINTARGGIVNEVAAVNAIKSNQIAGLAVDVLETEPPSMDSPLLAIAKQPNVIITPHIAWASDEAMQHLANVVAANVDAFAKGEPINIVSNT